MEKHLLYCISLAVLAAMTTSSLAQDDPNLVGWWTFDDEGTGTVLDSSGNGHHGTFRGDAHFVPGLLGEAVAFDGNGDYVNIDGYKGIVGDGTGIHAFTIAAWIKATGNGEIVGWGSTVVPGRAEFRINDNRLRYESGGGNVQGDTTVTDDEWHHVAVTVPTDALYVDVTIYLDGEDDTQPENDTDPTRPTAQYDLKMGLRYNESGRAYTGLIDDVRLYDKVLTQAEIQALAVRPRAYNPSPADGAIGVTDPILSWQPRQMAVFHDVYLSTSPELGPDDLVSARQTSLMYWHGPGLEPGTAYYWKVDEIDADETVHPGDVWTFFFSPLEAWQPVPMDGSPYADPGLTLSWQRGLNGISHDVYFGTDETAVVEGAADAFQGNQFTMTFTTGDLEMDTTYYWRVDEVDMAGNKVTGNVWSFSTLPEIPITDPNLVAWWKFDAGIGTRVTDWSGHGNHGESEGDPAWVEGYDGYALEFDGIDDSVVKSFDAAESWPGLTISLWVKAAMLGQSVWKSPFSNHYPNTAGFQIDVDGGTPGSYRINPSGLLFGAVRTEWVHLAVAATGTSAKLYYNGLWTASGTLTDTTFNQIAAGRNRNIDSRFAGAIDDLRVFDRELSQEELELVMRIDPLRAWNPNPGHGSMADIRTATPLTWTKGDEASQHDAYFGTDEAAVAAADASDTTGVYRGQFSATSYTPDEDLQWGQKYFWRVDELNADGSTTTGRVWNFTVADYLIVDDFESYTDNFDAGLAIFQTWIDGWTDGTNGSIVGNLEAPFAEQTIVYSGRQAMPMDYNNILSPWYSEAERTWETTQDWTFGDVNTLVVFFRGQVPSFIETAPDAITLSAAGADIWDMYDEFRYAFKRLDGDGTIIGRIESLIDTHASAKAGLMIRETLDPGARFAMVYMTGNNGLRFGIRQANNDVVTNDGAVATPEQSALREPVWMKLERIGNEFNAYYSDDGVVWTPVVWNPQTVVMGSSLYVGVALTSHAAGTPTTAEFSGIQTTGNVTGPWEVVDVGVDHPGNTPDRMYVAVEDSAGHVAVVTHPNPSATTITEYEPWAIDLASLAGVNASRVKTMYIGVGDRDNPMPGGTGRIYVDDIRVMRGAPTEPNEVEVVE